MPTNPQKLRQGFLSAMDAAISASKTFESALSRFDAVSGALSASCAPDAQDQARSLAELSRAVATIEEYAGRFRRDLEHVRPSLRAQFREMDKRHL